MPPQVNESSLVEDFDGFAEILQLAETLPGLINKGEGLEALRTTDELLADNEMDIDTDAEQWHCPNCNVSELDTNFSAIGV